MSWGGRPFRPLSFGFFCGRRLRQRARLVIEAREVVVDEPMTESPAIILPARAHNLAFSTDLYQRVYVVALTDRDLSRTIKFQAGIYQAPSLGGIPPDLAASWALIPETYFSASCNVAYTWQQMPEWFDGFEYVDLWTYVYQLPSDWRGPFKVVHELWGNEFNWTRMRPKGQEGRPDYPAQTRDVDIRQLGRARG